MSSTPGTSTAGRRGERRRRPIASPRRNGDEVLAALAAVRVNSRAQELVMLHAWLDAWSGLGAIVVGMQHGRWHCRAPGAGSIVGLSVSGSLMKEGARDGCAHHARDGLWRS